MTFRTCRAEALRTGEFDYNGLSGDIELLANGDPGETGFSVVEFTGTGALRVVDEVTVQSASADVASPDLDPIFGPPGDGVLTVATLLPIDGPRPASARGALAGVQLAVQDINGMDGVLAEPIVLLPDGAGDGSAAATDAAVTSILGSAVDAVIGGTTYDITGVALGPLSDAGIVMVSPTDSALALATAADRGLFFRMSPPPSVEGTVLGRQIANNGYTKVGILVGSTADDLQLVSEVKATLEAAEATVSVQVIVPSAADAAAAVQQVVDADPQAILVATSGDTTAATIKALVDLGKGPKVIQTYGTSADMTADLAVALGG